MLAGKTATHNNFLPVAERLLQGAQGFGYNTFKIELACRAIARALRQAVDNV